jgi:hypothetical protein
VHHQAVLHDLGLIPISRVSAARAAVKAPRRTGGRRVPKSTYVEDKTIETPTGKQTVSLDARDGALGLGRLTETGDLHFEHRDASAPTAIVRRAALIALVEVEVVRPM